MSDFDQTLAMRLAMCTPATYTNIMKSVRKCLNIQPKVTLRTLGVALGCTSMIPYVEKFFDEFQKRYIASLSAAKKMATSDELALPRWKGGAFYICSKSLGVSGDRVCLLGCLELLTRICKTGEIGKGFFSKNVFVYHDRFDAGRQNYGGAL